MTEDIIQEAKAVLTEYSTEKAKMTLHIIEYVCGFLGGKGEDTTRIWITKLADCHKVISGLLETIDEQDKKLKRLEKLD